MADFPSPEQIQRELDDVWPGWRLHNGEPINMDLPFSRLPTPNVRRIKWLLKVHLMQRNGRIAEGWGATCTEITPGRVLVHAIPGRGYRSEDEPPRVGAPPMTAGMKVAPRSSVAAIAIATRKPIPEVQRLLALCPPEVDAEAFVRAGGAL